MKKENLFVYLIVCITLLMHSLSAATFKGISRFAQLDQIIQTLKPNETTIFIDIDETLLKDGKGGEQPATFLDPEAATYIHAWIVKGYKLCLLTARLNKHETATRADLAMLGMSDVPFLMTNGNEKGKWLTENKETHVRVQALLSSKNIVHLDDQHYQLQSMQEKLSPHYNCHIFHFQYCFGDETLPAVISPKLQRTIAPDKSLFRGIDAQNKNMVILKKIKAEMTQVESTDKPKYVGETASKISPQEHQNFKMKLLVAYMYETVAKALPDLMIHTPRFRINRNKISPDEYAYSAVRESFTDEDPAILVTTQTHAQKLRNGYLVDLLLSSLTADEHLEMFLADGKVYRTFSFSPISDNGTALITQMDKHVAVNDLRAQIMQLKAIEGQLLLAVDQFNRYVGIDGVAQIKTDLSNRLNAFQQTILMPD